MVSHCTNMKSIENTVQSFPEDKETLEAFFIYKQAGQDTELQRNYCY